MKQQNIQEQLEMLVEKIREAVKGADAVLIGASNGLSISDGYHIFADNEWFRENFGDFRSKYGIQNLLQGMFLQFSCPEEQWAFYSRLAYRVHYAQKPSRMMLELYHLVREDVLRMASAEKNGMVPAELLPKCPKCGGLMEPNLPKDQSFFLTEGWQKKSAAYQAFVQKYHGKRLVILEFGIGYRNQMIKAPLMQLAAAEPHCTYITFNKGELYIPAELKNKSIGVDGDIGEAIHKIAAIT